MRRYIGYGCCCIVLKVFRTACCWDDTPSLQRRPAMMSRTADDVSAFAGGGVADMAHRSSQEA